MNGIHDMGGMHGFGPVQREENEPVFHAPWESRVWGMEQVLRLQGKWFTDESRKHRESLPPAQYLASSYYEIWLAALETIVVEKGLLTPEELAARTAQLSQAPDPLAAVPRREDPALAALIEQRRRAAGTAPPPAGPPPRFQDGDRVLARNLHPEGHTRIPRYVRGKAGTIHRTFPPQHLPDAVVAGVKRPEAVYAVRFAARDLWGETASPTDTVIIDLWESYLDPA